MTATHFCHHTHSHSQRPSAQSQSTISSANSISVIHFNIRPDKYTIRRIHPFYFTGTRIRLVSMNHKVPRILVSTKETRLSDANKRFQDNFILAWILFNKLRKSKAGQSINSRGYDGRWQVKREGKKILKTKWGKLTKDGENKKGEVYIQ